MVRSAFVAVPMLLASMGIAQNIAINNTGAAAVPSAMLEITSTDRGLLIPRVALTAINVAGPIAAPANSLLVYNTAAAGVAPNNVTPGYYYWSATAWIRLLGTADGWRTLGNAGTNAAVNFLGTTDNVDLVFRTNNLARARIMAGGAVVVNNAAPAAGDVFSAYAAAGNFAVNGYSTGNVGAGVYGFAQNQNSMGIWGEHALATGTGTASVGNGAGVAQTLVAGSGAAFTGLNFGMASFRNLNTNVNGQGSAYFLGSAGGTGQFAYVSFFNGGLWYKILGTGSVSTIVDDPVHQRKAVMFAPEAPEIFLQDQGSGRLVNGRARIEIDPILSANIVVDDAHPLRVFVQLEGECNGVYVTNKSGQGFDVVELMGGDSDASFSWFLSANRSDEIDPLTGQVVSANSGARFPQAPSILETNELRRNDDR